MRKNHSQKNIIEIVIERLGGNKEGIARRVGVSKGAVYGWIKNGKVAEYCAARMLGELANVDPDLLTDYAGYKRKLQNGREGKGDEANGNGPQSGRKPRKSRKPDHGS